MTVQADSLRPSPFDIDPDSATVSERDAEVGGEEKASLERDSIEESTSPPPTPKKERKEPSQ